MPRNTIGMSCLVRHFLLWRDEHENRDGAWRADDISPGVALLRWARDAPPTTFDMSDPRPVRQAEPGERGLNRGRAESWATKFSGLKEK